MLAAAHNVEPDGPRVPRAAAPEPAVWLRHRASNGYAMRPVSQTSALNCCIARNIGLIRYTADEC